NNLSILNEFVPDNVLGIVRDQANRIASNRGSALSLGIVVGIVVSLWSAMSGVKAMIDALNVIYEQKESRSFIKLNLVALAFTLAGLICSEHCSSDLRPTHITPGPGGRTKQPARGVPAAFLVAIASIVVLPLILS